MSINETDLLTPCFYLRHVMFNVWHDSGRILKIKSCEKMLHILFHIISRTRAIRQQYSALSSTWTSWILNDNVGYAPTALIVANMKSWLLQVGQAKYKNRACHRFNSSGLSASPGSAPLHFSDKLEDVFSEQLGLLKGSKVTTTRHQSVGVDVEVLCFGPSLGAVH